MAIIDDSLGTHKSLSEVWSERDKHGPKVSTSIHISLGESIRRLLEETLGKPLSTVDLANILVGIAMGRVVLRDVDKELCEHARIKALNDRIAGLERENRALYGTCERLRRGRW